MALNIFGVCHKHTFILYFRCLKSCAEWKGSIGGTLFAATEPENCDCDQVTLGKIEEDFSEEDQ